VSSAIGERRVRSGGGMHRAKCLGKPASRSHVQDGRVQTGKARAGPILADRGRADSYPR
jgi:hypothetical protein